MWFPSAGAESLSMAFFFGVFMFKMRNWSSFQSYKDRSPPWIRLHKNLLDNFEFQRMSADARAILPMLWLMASEDENPVTGLLRFGYEVVSFRLRQPEKIVRDAIREIIRSGFIEEINDETSDSYGIVTKSLRNCHPETETETETETEIIASAKPEKKKVKLADLSVDHIAEWLSKKRAEGRYLLHNEHEVLEKFKDYCLSTGRKYADYTAAYRNAFDWDKCKPSTATLNKDERARIAVARGLSDYEAGRSKLAEKQW